MLLALIWRRLDPGSPGNPGRSTWRDSGGCPSWPDGRIKPLDTIARTSLLMLQGRQRG
jgi:hypothetical protein